jgi:hypothetical protein
LIFYLKLSIDYIIVAMSDIEDGLFNNSDDDNDSDVESVAESEVD